MIWDLQFFLSDSRHLGLSIFYSWDPSGNGACIFSLNSRHGLTKKVFPQHCREIKYNPGWSSLNYQLKQRRHREIS